MKNHLLWRWDFRLLVVSVCGLFLGWAGRPFWLGFAQSVLDEGFYSAAEFGLFLVGVSTVVFWISLPCVLFFGVAFCRRYFSAENRYRRIVDREERLDAERRRREEDGR